MTGPEHYEEAERLLESREEEATARAQVHATLALAAATALQDVDLLPGHDADMWMDVAGTPCPPPLVTGDAHSNGGSHDRS
jgi:hypothetical protein